MPGSSPLHGARAAAKGCVSRAVGGEGREKQGLILRGRAGDVKP
jgi:hypothetical protein